MEETSGKEEEFKKFLGKVDEIGECSSSIQIADNHRNISGVLSGTS